MKKPKKYHYEIETCGDCGHTKRYRVYHWPKSNANDGRVTRDIGPLLAALDCDPMPATRLMSMAGSISHAQTAINKVMNRHIETHYKPKGKKA